MGHIRLAWLISLALPIWGCPSRPSPKPAAGQPRQVAYLVDAEGATGTVVIDGVTRSGGAANLAALWPVLGLESAPLPRVTCDAPLLPIRIKGDEGVPGKGTLPPDYLDGGYPGSSGGGCGTFAALMCDDILDGQSRPVTRDRWRKAHDGIGEDASGGSDLAQSTEYHRKRIDGCSRGETLKPGDEDTILRLKGRGCDCKLTLFMVPEGSHVEVITGVTTNAAGQKCLQTNSWGDVALVCGHDQFNGDDLTHTVTRDKGGPIRSPRFPRGGTQAGWVCVCPKGSCAP